MKKLLNILHVHARKIPPFLQMPIPKCSRNNIHHGVSCIRLPFLPYLSIVEPFSLPKKNPPKAKLIIISPFTPHSASQNQNRFKTREEEVKPHEVPKLQSSTPRTSNFSPSSLNSSFPNVRHLLLIPLSKLSSSHNP